MKEKLIQTSSAPNTRTPGIFRLIAIAIIAGATITLAFWLDGTVRESILATQPKGWNKTPTAETARALSKYGDWPELMALGALGLAIAIGTRNRRWTRILVAAMLASTLAGVAANSLRLTTGRTRPRESPAIEQGFYGLRHEGRWLVGDPAYNSFPSGHTATAFGFAAVILLASPAWGLPAVIVAALIAWSRMAVGAHHFSDVVVSICLGGAAAYLTWRVIENRWDGWSARWHRKSVATPPA